MLPPFAFIHIPPLVVATATTLGGLIPFFNAERAILDFGLPARIASEKPAQAIMVLKCGRITAFGLTLWTFYAQGKLEEFDTVLMILGGYVGAVDAWVCWKEGVPGKAVFRGLSGTCICLWGLLGLTGHSVTA
ncbi:hypothetical protein BDW71DRAFT_95881 [Aspergillus fruticulosus]